MENHRQHHDFQGIRKLQDTSSPSHPYLQGRLQLTSSHQMATATSICRPTPSHQPRLYGGRPECEAQSLTFLEELKYDISHVTRHCCFGLTNQQEVWASSQRRTCSCHNSTSERNSAIPKAPTHTKSSSLSLAAVRVAATHPVFGYSFYPHCATSINKSLMGQNSSALTARKKSRSLWLDL
jgi:hypothetical protein